MSSRLQAVLDTSVWVSGVFFGRGSPYQVLRAWRDGRFEVVCTPEALAEIEAKLREKALAFGADLAHVSDWIAYIQTYARMVPSMGVGAGVCRDPNDDKFLDAAVSGGAGYIVSGDRDLLALSEYQGVKIVAPKEFLALLSGWVEQVD